MPLYQLPTGKTVYLTTEQILDLTDADIQYLVASGYGAEPSNPFFGSVLRKGQVKDTDDTDDYYDRDGIDYDPDDDEPSSRGPINLDDLPDESITD